MLTSKGYNVIINSLFPQSVAVSSGTSTRDYDQLESIVKAIPDIGYICLDVANGYSEHFVDFLRNVRKAFPSQTILVRKIASQLQFLHEKIGIKLKYATIIFKAGNVVTGEMVEELILSGADIIKVGIGPGKLCLLYSFLIPSQLKVLCVLLERKLV